MFKIKISLILVLFMVHEMPGQIWDAFTTSASLTYAGNNVSRWAVSSDTYRSSTGGSSAIDYVSTDMTVKIPAWELNKTYTNEWSIWMSTSRTSISGWGGTSYSFAFVLAANNANLTSTSCQGYALLYRDTDDKIYLVKFSRGINSNVETNSTNIISSIGTIVSGTAGTETTNGKNLYVKYESDGKWTVKWLNGNKLTNVNAAKASSYTTGTSTSAAADETYTGVNYKYTGFVWNHSTSGTAYGYWDNLGFSMNGASPWN
ncbi:hypothetical protein MASR1M107_16640 [Ignavibacteriales bacterium]